MKIVSVVYSNDNDFILDLVNSFPQKKILETFNVDNYKEKRRAISLLARHGTKNTPLVVFKDENFEERDAIWSESNPDWFLELSKRFNE